MQALMRVTSLGSHDVEHHLPNFTVVCFVLHVASSTILLRVAKLPYNNFFPILFLLFLQH